MDQEILTVLEPQEKIVWQDIVNRKVMSFYLVLSLAITLGISLFLFSKETINYTSNNVPKTVAGTTVGLIVLIVGLIISLLVFFSNYVKIYVITNKRVLIKSGLIGTDFNSIYFTQIRSANVNVGLIDKMFSVGTLNIDTGKIETVQTGDDKHPRSQTQTAYDKLLHISRPYEVYKYFQTTLTSREESLYSGRADRENNPTAYRK
jgi:membrane protein YdbS with pleckstrin-like domain